MKRKILAICLTSLIGLTTFSGCGKKEMIVDTITPTPTIEDSGYISSVTIAPQNNIIFDDGHFVLYENGQNNYTDKNVADTMAAIVPEEYKNYKTLLNHDFSFSGKENYSAINTQNVTYKEIATYKYGVEVEFNTGAYKIRNIIPIDFVWMEEFESYSDYKINENNKLTMMDAIIETTSKSTVATWYNDYMGVGEELETYINSYKEMNTTHYMNELSKLFTFEKGCSYQFIKQDNFIIFVVDAKIRNDYFEQDLSNTYGKALLIVDTSNGSRIIHYIATNNDRLNDVNNQYYMKDLMDEIPYVIKITKN